METRQERLIRIRGNVLRFIGIAILFGVTVWLLAATIRGV